jgi:transcriptional regulator with XRE-family HTH domain
MLHFAKNLKLLMKTTATTQVQLESVVNKRQTTISNWLNGKGSPDAEDLVRLSSFFAISIDDLCLIDLSHGNLISEDYLANFRQFGNLKGNPMGNPMAHPYHFSGNPASQEEEGQETYLWAILQAIKLMDKKLDAFEHKLEQIRLSRDKGQDQG